MHAQDFELLYKLEEKYWWFVGMRRITDTIVSSELQKPDLCILDAGCGTGFNLNYYGSLNSGKIFGLDIADTALGFAMKRGIRTFVQASIAEIPFKPETFDLIFSFEVITQMPPDVHDCAFREIHRVLKPGGFLFLRVPAFMWLWSSHDEQLQVFYRYTRPELVQRLSNLGYCTEWASYANTLLFPLILLRRFLKHLGIGRGSDVKPLPPGFEWLNSIFRQTLEIEAGWFRSGRSFPFGLSLICYAKKMPSIR